MAANIHIGGITDDSIIFNKPVNYLNIFVDSGVTFSLSLDKGTNYIEIPVGFHSFMIGSVLDIKIMANGNWSILAVQA